ELDFLVDFSKKYDEVIGARMMGGGFGGCTINIIHRDAVTAFVKEASKAYFEKFNIKLTAFEAMPSEGTRINYN
ncbi:galactokinase, partial [Aureibaculum marinum]